MTDRDIRKIKKKEKREKRERKSAMYFDKKSGAVKNPDIFNIVAKRERGASGKCAVPYRLSAVFGGLPRSLFHNHYPHRHQQNPDIGSQAPVVDILQIQLQDFPEICDITPAADLPQAGETRLDT